jgi:lipopolysaccharide cholinephosphotransferase
MTVKQIERKIRRLIVLEEPTHTVCNMTEAGPSIKGCFPAEDIASSVDIEFEGKLYKTMAGYKDYLKRTYGDYMTLPPVEQRVTHKFEAYRLD